MILEFRLFLQYMESQLLLGCLDNQTISKDIQELGFSKACLEDIKSIQKLSSGLVLIAGPTGSGKEYNPLLYYKEFKF